MDLTALQGIQSPVIKKASESIGLGGRTESGENADLFSGILNSAIDNINQANSYAQDAQNERMKLAMGETENSHDLTIALQKSSSALTYTIAVRDKFLEAYKEIMNMQI